MTDRVKLVDLLMDELPEKHPWEGNVKCLVDKLLAAGVTFQKWIPVSERLPEQYKTVIGWTSLREMGEVSHDGKHFVWMDDDGLNDYANVTHWMPLPEPPNENENV